MADNMDPSSVQILKAGLVQTEEDIRSGKLSAEVAVDSLAEVDGYYFSARQADGTRVTGLLLRTRQQPCAYFVIPGMAVVGNETAKILNDRLPPPPAATPAPKRHPKQPDNPQAVKSAKAGAMARARGVAKPLRTPPGSLSPEELQLNIPPLATGGDDRIPQG